MPKTPKPRPVSLAKLGQAVRKATPKKRAPKLVPMPHIPAPVQIAVTSNAYGGGGNVVEAITVLMDDGTMWRYPMVGAEPEHRVWTQIPPVGTTGVMDTKE